MTPSLVAECLKQTVAENLSFALLVALQEVDIGQEFFQVLVKSLMETAIFRNFRGRRGNAAGSLPKRTLTVYAIRRPSSPFVGACDVIGGG